MTTLAIDIGGTKLAAALVDDDLNLLKRRELPTPASKMPEALCSALQELIVPLFARAQRVAIASTGIISGGVLSAINPHNLGGLQHFPLTQTLEKSPAYPHWRLTMRKLRHGRNTMLWGMNVATWFSSRYPQV